MPVPVVEKCTHEFGAQRRGGNYIWERVGKERENFYLSGEYLTVVHPIYLSVQARRLFKSNTELGTPTITYLGTSVFMSS